MHVRLHACRYFSASNSMHHDIDRVRPIHSECTQYSLEGAYIGANAREWEYGGRQSGEVYRIWEENLTDIFGFLVWITIGF